MKWKAFFIIFKGLLLDQIEQIHLEGESPTLTYLARFANICIVVFVHKIAWWD